MMRRGLIALLIVLAAAAGLYGGYWWWSAERLARGLEQWRAQQVAEGYQIHYRAPEIGGFPGRLSVTLRNPEVIAPAGWRWAGPTLRGSAAPWRPLRIAFSAPGRHLLVLPTAKGAQAFDIDAGRAQAELVLNRRGTAERLDIDPGTVTAVGPGGQEASAERIRVETGPLPPDRADAALDAEVQVTGLNLPARTPAPLGHRIDYLVVEGSLRGPLPTGPPRAALAAWQAGDGELLLHALALSWGPLAADGDGRLALDPLLRPRGEINARLSGYGEALDRLAAQGLIDPGAAAGGKLVLGALARPGGEDGRPVVELPITLRDGRFFLGPLGLFPLPSLL